MQKEKISSAGLSEESEKNNDLFNSHREILSEHIQLKAVFDHLPIGLCIIDKDLRYLQLNQVFADMDGMSVAAHLGKTIKEVVPDLSEQAETALKNIIATGEPLLDLYVAGETSSKPGVKCIWKENWVPYRDENEQIIGIIVTAENITDKVLNEKEKEQYRFIFENSFDAILLTSPDGAIHRANPAACVMFQMSEEEICGVGRSGIVDMSDVKIPSILKDREMKGALRAEFTFIRKDETVFPGDCTSTLFKDYEGKVWTSMIIRDITTYKNIMNDLENQAKILHAINDAIVVADRSFRIISWNERAEKIYGWKEEEVLGKLAKDVLRSELPLRESHYLELERGEAVTTEAVQYTRDNRKIIVSGYTVPLRDENGEINSYVAINHDITERKQMEEMLRNSEEKFRTMIETAGEGIMIAKPDGPYTYVNDRMAEMLGYAKEEILGKSSMDFSSRDRHPQVVQARKSLSKHNFVQGEFKFIRKDGQALWTSCNISPMFNDLGEHIANFVMHTDITERKRTEEALRSSEKKYKNLFNSLNEGACIIEVIFNDENEAVDWRYLETNPSYYLHSVFTNVEGKLISELNPNLEKYWLELYGKVALTGNPARYENWASQTNRWLNVSAFKVGENNERKVCVIIKDVTERKENELQIKRLLEELQQNDKNKNEFLSVLSHELRNPLATIVAGLSLMDKAKPGGDKDLRAKEIIKRQTYQLNHLVNDLLDITRINNNKIILKKERVDLNQLINDTVNEYMHQFLDKKIELIFDMPSSPIYLDIDPVRLNQTISNLLNNAEKFSRSGDKTCVKLFTDNDHVIIIVSDTGAGVPPELLPGLFEPFIQEERTLARSNGGLGLGLAISKGIVELHGGTIIAQSEGIGCGTTFKIMLPIISE